MTAEIRVGDSCPNCAGGTLKVKANLEGFVVMSPSKDGEYHTLVCSHCRFTKKVIGYPVFPEN